MSPGSLVLVGSGIKFLSHMTVEVKAYIEQSDIVLYLTNEPAMEQWITKSNANVESLEKLYTSSPARKDCYVAITKRILEVLKPNKHVCVVFYGHPTVFAEPGLAAILQAKNEGYDTKIIPAISSEDCLFADLAINPGSSGCQSFEATDFLISQRKFDPNCHLILWQVSTIGFMGHPKNHDSLPNIKILLNYLLNFYNKEHSVIIYEAAQYPHMLPRIEKISLKNLANVTYTSLSTLYITPKNETVQNSSMIQSLKIKF